MNSLDTLGYCKRLEAVGVPREQAEVHAQILTEVITKVATKDGLKELEVATKDGMKKLEVGLKELEVATKRDLNELEVRLKEWVALYVKEQIAELKADILKWFIAVSIAQASFVIAVLRYLPH
ncbi:hypothetical protein SAMN05216319_4646 [Duganella sp. CF402]|uniref:hypothetical protein n=1 Tax=unclassified Duganella TaxID=2636909 RepID=UPI0008B71955|nr:MULTISPECIES: hypothetical protein [unclassified Duganella]RZT06129.1 hypothetical protein EV582_4455 [Duganella sp. BK701]SEM74982.1 hypothetical protein SAMN05216319_4646 [Duganella sp. CF402]